ncbi:MAG: hypothetical protein J3R72DRAFT_495732 [Linnemannia gamsii]|nr:MAG: hypothetical protein J3R72DRAFT_495732 [Linnemannia gamsii]
MYAFIGLTGYHRYTAPEVDLMQPQYFLAGAFSHGIVMCIIITGAKLKNTDKTNVYPPSDAFFLGLQTTEYGRDFLKKALAISTKHRSNLETLAAHLFL